MHTGTLIVIVVSLALLFCAIELIQKKNRRKRMMNEPFPPEWLGIIEKNVPLYRLIPNELKKTLLGFTRVIIAEKNFEGCGGLKMTDEIKVTIAVQAAILLLNGRPHFFPKVDSILVYPHPYVAERPSSIGYNINEPMALLGESSIRGAVVIAWDHARQRNIDDSGGHNVVLHEFAHQLDQEDGRGDGVPLLSNWSSYKSWGRVLGMEYDHLRENIRAGVSDIIDEYGATNPAEFFAVCTETFFEKPAALKNQHPELYEQLKNFYALNPAGWKEEG